ncbi:hypothetical protein KBI33_01840 [Candidatus Shapirobacteria bacterium]|nr:hypothetical protein [Candidatus Shapirobacteria bacterium]
MVKECFPPCVRRLHQMFLNPCDPEKGAFGIIGQRQKRRNESPLSFPEENQEKEEVNIPNLAVVSDTRALKS